MEGKKGFTIIELLVVLVVLATMMAGVLPLISSAINKNKDARLKLIAYEAASAQLEEYREQKVSSLLVGENSFTVPELPNSTATVTIEKPHLPGQSFATIIASVNWVFNNRNQNVTLKTYLYGSTQ